VTTTAAPTFGHYEEISVDKIMPAPDNLRGDLGDLTDLAESIRANGLHQPLTVAGGDFGDGYLLVDGHRRHAAAKQAGVTTVACYVRHYTEAERTEAMLVTALHREDLDPIEEARGYARLTELGLSQRKIAGRVGRTQPHISKRLSLLKLPDVAQEKVAGGQLKLDDALELAAMPAESQQRVLTEGDAGNLEWSIRQEKHRLQRTERAAKLRAWLRDHKHVTLLGDNTNPPTDARYIGFTDKAGAYPSGAGGATHDKGHACCIARFPKGADYANWYCTDPAHVAAKPQQQRADTRAEDERLEQLAAAAAARRAAIARALDDAKDGFVEAKTLLTHAAVQLLDSIYFGDDLAFELVGVDDHDGLLELAGKSADDAVRALIAAAFGFAEAELSTDLRWRSADQVINGNTQDAPGRRRHLEFLVTELGYKPTDDERAALNPGEGADT